MMNPSSPKWQLFYIIRKTLFIMIILTYLKTYSAIIMFGQTEYLSNLVEFAQKTFSILGKYVN